VALLGRIGRRDAEPNPVVEHGGAVIAGDVYDEPPVWNPAIQKPDAPNATAPAAASSFSKAKV
jgi:hypothetical protein